MRPDAADRSSESAAERLRQALAMHEAGVAMMRLSLQRRFGSEQGERRLQEWLFEADGELPGFEPATLRRPRARFRCRPPRGDDVSALGEALGALGRDLQSCGVPHALVGGLAVSVRTEPRFTRDIDVVAAVAAEEIDRLGRHLVERGHRIESILADASGALVAGLRLRGHGVREDVLLACSGLEAETCASAEPIEVLPGVVVPVATTPHLLVLELIAIAERSRTQDRADVEALIDAATDDERAAVEALLPRVRSAHGTPPERLVQLWRGVSRG